MSNKTGMLIVSLVIIVTCLVVYGLIKSGHSSDTVSEPDSPTAAKVPDTDQSNTATETKSGTGSVMESSSDSGKTPDPDFASESDTVHTKDCDTCHGDKDTKLIKAGGLMEQIPSLCFKCHEDNSKGYRYVHGPVAMGQCMFCHEPHKSDNPHMLKLTVPELCNSCHTQEDLGTIDKHLERSHTNCLMCHNNHSSNERFLLKKNQP